MCTLFDFGSCIIYCVQLAKGGDTIGSRVWSQGTVMFKYYKGIMYNMNKMKLKFYVPRGDWAESEEIGSLLEEVKNDLNIDYEKSIITEEEERNLKEDILLSPSVSKRIKIKQSKKGKSLYPQLVVFVNGKAATFYPQQRVKEAITIQEFLTGLLNGEVKCLHEKYEIENELKK